jgi:bifunctional non-homologous end joining protein LigD
MRSLGTTPVFWLPSPMIQAMSSLSSRTRSGPAGFIEPCLPSPADKPPSGPGWLHEIKHDGYRLMARRDPVGIRLVGPLSARNRGREPPQGAVLPDRRGGGVLRQTRVALFHVLRRRRDEADAFLYAFDLLELDGTDLRREPIEVRKATLASILRKSRPGVRLNEHLEHDCGLTVFQHACKMGLEGIVSKRLGSHYRSGRSPDWLKFKNPEAPAVKREAEEDCGR